MQIVLKVVVRFTGDLQKFILILPTAAQLRAGSQKRSHSAAGNLLSGQAQPVNCDQKRIQVHLYIYTILFIYILPTFTQLNVDIWWQPDRVGVCWKQASEIL